MNSLGSIAAWIQATFYGAAIGTGSLFAIAQSVAMGGMALIPAVMAVISGAGAVALAALVAVIL